MKDILRTYIKSIIFEIVNDTAMARGFGTLEIDRQNPQKTYATGDMDDMIDDAEEEENNPLFKAANTDRGTSNRRTMPGVS